MAKQTLTITVERYEELQMLFNRNRLLEHQVKISNAKIIELLEVIRVLRRTNINKKNK